MKLLTQCCGTGSDISETRLLSIHQIKKSIDAYSPVRPELGGRTRRAAVAVILRQVASETEALFILRAIRTGDPWSGQIAFPGGHYEAGDASLRHTAERETQEEIDLDLTHAGRYIGQLDPVQASPRREVLDIVVTPFVYELREPAAKLSPNHEVAELLWGSLNEMHAGLSHTRMEIMIQGEAQDYPGYGLGDRVVWGLTYRILEQLFALLDLA